MTGKRYTIPQFSDALKRLESHVRGEVLKKAALAGAETIVTYAKINVEKTFKGGPGKTGNLLNNWVIKVESATADSVKVSAGPGEIYGRIQELGGVIKPVTAKMLHWVDESGQHHQAYAVTLPARPYLRPAVDEHTDSIWKAVAENLRIEIEGQI